MYGIHSLHKEQNPSISGISDRLRDWQQESFHADQGFTAQKVELALGPTE